MPETFLQIEKQYVEQSLSISYCEKRFGFVELQKPFKIIFIVYVFTASIFIIIISLIIIIIISGITIIISSSVLQLIILKLKFSWGTYCTPPPPV